MEASAFEKVGKISNPRPYSWTGESRVAENRVIGADTKPVNERQQAEKNCKPRREANIFEELMEVRHNQRGANEEVNSYYVMFFRVLGVTGQIMALCKFVFVYLCLFFIMFI